MYTRNANAPRTIGGLLEDFFHGGMSPLWDHQVRSDSRPVNIQDTEKAFIIQLMAPGLVKEDFKLNIDRNILTISCEQKETEKEENGKWIRNEFRLTSFRRSFTLNEKIDTAGISATYTNGILSVVLPKKESTTPQVQSIQVN